MWRKLLCWYLAWQHLFVTTVQATSSVFIDDVIEVTRSRDDRKLKIKIYAHKATGEDVVVWKQKLQRNDTHFITPLSDAKSSYTQNKKLSQTSCAFLNQRRFLQIKSGTDKKGYRLNISPKGAISLDFLNTSRKLKIQTCDKLMMGRQSIFKAERLILGAPSIFIQGRLDCDWLKLKALHSKVHPQTSLVINPSGRLAIGQELHVQSYHDDQGDLVPITLQNQGVITNRKGRDHYRIDLRGNDLLNAPVGEDPTGASINEITSIRSLEICGVNTFHNRARVYAGDLTDDMREDRTALLLVNAEGLENENVIDSEGQLRLTSSWVRNRDGSTLSGHSTTLKTNTLINETDALIRADQIMRLKLGLGTSHNFGTLQAGTTLKAKILGPFLNEAIFNAGEDIVINLAGTLINKKLLSSRGLMSLKGACDASLLYNHGRLEALRGIALDLPEVQQTGILTTVKSTLADNSLPDTFDPTQGLIHINGGYLENSGEIISPTSITSPHLEKLHNTGQMIAAKDLDLNIERLENYHILSAGSALYWQGHSFTTSDQSTIEAQHTVLIGHKVHNKGDWLVENTCRLLLHKLVNHGTFITHSLDIPSLTLFKNRQNFKVEQNLAGQIQLIRNTGCLEAGQISCLYGKALTNSGTFKIQGKGNLNFEETLTNHHTFIVAGELHLTAKDLVQTEKAQLRPTKGHFRLHTLHNAGLMSTQGSLKLQSNDVVNPGHISAKKTLRWQGDRFKNTGQLIAGSTLFHGTSVKNFGTWDSGLNFTLKAHHLFNGPGATLHGDNLHLHQVKDLRNHGHLQATHSLWGTLEQLDNQGTLECSAIPSLHIGMLNNTGHIKIQDHAHVRVKQAFSNEGHLGSKGFLDVMADTLTQTSAGILKSLGELKLTLNHLEADGLVFSAYNLILNLRPSHSQTESKITGHLEAQGPCDLYIDGLLHLTAGGQLVAKGPLKLAGEGSLTNEGVLKPHALFNTRLRSFINHKPLVLASTPQEEPTFRVDTFQNDSEITSNTPLRFKVRQSFLNTAASKIVGNSDLIITGNAQLNNAGLIKAGDEMTLTGRTLTNTAELKSSKGITLKVKEILSNGGTIVADAGIIVHAPAIVNEGHLQASHHLQIKGEELTNLSQAVLTAQQELVLDLAKSLTNAGIIEGQAGLHTTTSALENQGVLSALVGPLSLATQIFGNQHLISSSTGPLNLALHKGTQKGVLFAKDDLTITIGERLEVIRSLVDDKPDISAHKDILITGSGHLINKGGILAEGQLITTLPVENSHEMSGHSVRLEGRHLTNHDHGLLYALHMLTAPDLDHLCNEGTLKSKEEMRLHAQEFLNAGAVTSAQNLDVTSHHIHNMKILSAGNDLSVQGHILFNQGNIASGARLTLATNVENDGKLGAQDVILSGKEVTNQQHGNLIAEQSLIARGLESFTNHGGVEAGQSLDISIHHLKNQGAFNVRGRGTFNVHAMTNTGWVHAGDALYVRPMKQLTNAGTIESADGLSVEGEPSESILTNTGSLRSSHKMTLAYLHTVRNAEGGTILGEQTVDLQYLGTLDNGGSVVSEMDFRLKSCQTVVRNHPNAIIAAHQTLSLERFDHLSNAGLLSGQHQAQFQGGHFNQDPTGHIVSGPLTLDLHHGINQGLIEVTGRAHLLVRDTFRNENGLQASDILHISATSPSSEWINTSDKAEVASATTLTFDAPESTSLKVNNQNSARILGHSAIIFNGKSQLSNTAYLITQGEVHYAGDVLENRGTLHMARLVAPRLQRLINHQGAVMAFAQPLHVDHLASVTNAGVIQSHGDIILTPQSQLDNTGSLLSQGGSILISRDAWTNVGKLIAQVALVLQVAHLTNSNLLAAVQGDVEINGTTITNYDTIEGHRIWLHAPEGSIENQGQIKADDHITLQAKNLILAGEKNIEADTIEVSTHSSLINPLSRFNPLSRLKLQSHQMISLVGGPALSYHLEVTSPHLVIMALQFCKGLKISTTTQLCTPRGLWGEGPLEIETQGRFVNSGDCYSSNDVLLLKAGEILNNTPNALLGGRGNSLIQASRTITNQGTIWGEDLSLVGTDLFNHKNATIEAQHHLDITLHGTLDNTVGTLQSQGSMSLTAATLRNHREGYDQTEVITKKHSNKPLPRKKVDLYSSGYDVFFKKMIKTVEETTRSASPAQIHARQDLAIQTGKLENDASEIVSAEGKITLVFSELKNIRKDLRRLIYKYRKDKNGIPRKDKKHISRWRKPVSIERIQELPALISAGSTVALICNGQPVTLDSKSNIPGVQSTGSIRGHRVGGVISGVFQHHTLRIPKAADSRAHKSRVVINLMDYLSAGAGHPYRYDTSGAKPFALSSLFAENPQQRADEATCLPFHGAQELIRQLAQGGSSIHSQALTPRTWRMSRPFLAKGIKDDNPGLTLGVLLYAGSAPGLTAHSFTQGPARVAVIADPHLTGRERLLMPPSLEAMLLQRALIHELGMPNVYANLPNAFHQLTVLQLNGVQETRRLKKLPPVDEAAFHTTRALIPQQEWVSPKLVQQFQDPALVYRLQRYAQEYVLVASFFMGKTAAKAFFKAFEAQIMGNYIRLHSDVFLCSGSMDAGSIKVSATQKIGIEGGKLRTREGDLTLTSDGAVTMSSTVTKPERGKIRHHRAQLFSQSGGIHVNAGSDIAFQGVSLDAGSTFHINAGGSFKEAGTHDVTIKKSKYTKKKKWGGKKTITTKKVTQKFNPNLYTARGKGGTIESQGNLKMQGAHLKAPKTTRLISHQGQVKIETGISRSKKSTSKSSSNVVWQKQKVTQSTHKTVHTLKAKGGLEIKAAKGAQIDVGSKKGMSLKKTLDQLEKHPETAWVKSLRNDPHIDWHKVNEVHSYWSKTKRGLTPGATLVVSLAVSIAMPSPFSVSGSPCWASKALCAMGNQGLRTLASLSAVSFINNKGDLGKVLDELASEESVCRISGSMLKALILGTPPTGLPEDLGEAGLHVLRHTEHAIGSRTIDATLRGKSVRKSLKGVETEIGINTLGSWGAGAIGKLRQDRLMAEFNATLNGHPLHNLPGIDGVTHKALHTLLGSGLGFVRGKNLKSALTGGAAALGAELIADAMLGDAEDFVRSKAHEAAQQGRQLSFQELRDAWQERTVHTADMAKFFVACGALFTDQDVTLAVETAGNALDNNLFFLAPALILTPELIALMGASLVVAGAWTYQNIQKRRQANGEESFSSNTMDTYDGVLTATPGFEPEYSRGQTLETPAADHRSSVDEGYQGAPDTARSKDQGFDPHTAPKMAILENQKANAKRVTEPDRSNRSAEKVSRADAAMNGAGGPTNLAQHQQYKTTLRRQMERPHAYDPELKETLERLHRRDIGGVGSGSTAAAVRHELRTGELVGGMSHLKKAQDGIRELERWLKANSVARPGDRAAAENMMLDLMDALKTKAKKK